jgi:hypothetical protein
MVGFYWSTTFPVVINSGQTVGIVARYTGDNTDREAYTTGTWSVAGGGSGNLEADAIKAGIL